uniref:Uncharacterized protein n=1 Tax=Oryzias latipes TaxID=8090 RepID=A0A3P9LUZ2_ORYLA
MRILLVGGKKTLTRKWLQPDAPTVDDWFKTIHDIYVMERLTFAIKMQTDKVFFVVFLNLSINLVTLKLTVFSLLGGVMSEQETWLHTWSLHFAGKSQSSK